jgi:hypothetical protein
MHYTGEKTVCHYGKTTLIIRRNTKFTFHDAEKFATELTKYLELTLKRNSNLRRSYLLGIRGKATRKFRPFKSQLKRFCGRHKLAMLEKA